MKRFKAINCQRCSADTAFCFACIFQGTVHVNMPPKHLEFIMPYILRNVVQHFQCLQNSDFFSNVQKVSESICVYRAINASGWCIFHVLRTIIFFTLSFDVLRFIVFTFRSSTCTMFVVPIFANTSYTS